MDSDTYSLGIPLDELAALARTYGPAALAKAGGSPHSRDDAHRVVEQVICPCIRGETCVCDALANEFLRLAMLFHRQRNENNPQGRLPWIDRWENEGGSVMDRESDERS